MSNELKGSSPRKLIRRTHNRNPTFQSFHINDLLHYDPVPENAKPSNLKGSNQQFYSSSKQNIFGKYIGAGRSKSTNKIQMDSLNLAEEDYSKKKMRNPIYFSNQVKQNSAEPLNLSTSRPKSTSAFLTSAINNLNFKSVAQIVVKQNHGYDIISNM